MKAVKRIAAAALSSALVFSFASMQAFAATAEEELDGVTVTYTTDKDEYESDETIYATLTLVNRSEEELEDVDLTAFVPDGYVLDSAVRSYNEASEDSDGGVYPSYDLEVVFVPYHSDEESSETSEESSEISEESSEISEESSETSEDSSKASEDSSKTSEDSELSTASEASQESKTSETTDVSTSSQTSTTGTTSTTSTVSTASTTVVTTSSASSTAAGTVKTGDSTNVLLIAVILTAAVALSIFCIKNKKARKFLSLMLCTALIGSAAVAASVNTSAAPDGEPETTEESSEESTEESSEEGSGRDVIAFPYKIGVTTVITVGGSEMELEGRASYSISKEAITISGVARDSAGEPVANATVVITSKSGAIYETVTDEEGNYSVDIPYEQAESYTIEFSAEGYKPVSKSVIDVEENRTINALFVKEEEELEGYCSLCFVFDPIQSEFGEELIDEYGSMIYVNEDAVIKKAAAYVYEGEDKWYRTLAFVGENITEAKYVPYLAADEKILYSGLDAETTMNTFTMQETDGVWSVFGDYSCIGVNIEDADGNYLTVHAKNIVGKNLRVFDNLEEMKTWLLSDEY